MPHFKIPEDGPREFSSYVKKIAGARGARAGWKRVSFVAFVHASIPQFACNTP